MSGPEQPGFWRRTVALLTKDDEPELEVEQDPMPTGPFPIAQARVRQRIDCRGVVRTTGVVSYGSGLWFAADFADATGQLTVVWMGRSELPGVQAGRRLRIRGRLTVNRGRRIVFNPDYAIEAEPTDDGRPAPTSP